MASIRDRLRDFALIGALAGLAMAAGGVQAGVDLPQLEKGKGDRCVEDTQYMRRNHMELLKQHRDQTMHQGIRTTRHSLKGCVECHASAKSGSVAAGKEDFCAACHSYAGVKLDCWDCHANKPGKRPILNLPSAAAGGASPLMATGAQGGN